MTTMFGASSSGPEYGSCAKTSMRGAGDLARLERRDQRGLVDELAARGVDDPHAVLHPRDRVGADRRRASRRSAAGAAVTKSARASTPSKRVALDAELAEALGGDERVVGDDAHLQPDARGGRPAGRSGRSRARRASSRPARRRPTSSAPSGPRRAPRAPAGCCARARRAGRPCARPPRRCSTRARSRPRSRGASRPRRRRCRPRRPRGRSP